jgi:hypothetical protein
MEDSMTSPRLQRSAWPAGDYEGELLEGQRHGKGVMKFWNGNMYCGEFLRDRFEGSGAYSWADGRTFKGEFKEDQICGKGIARWPDGKVYEGEWVADLPDGRGILTLADKRVFEGTFREDYPVIGQMIEANGLTFFANFDGTSHASEWRPFRKCRVGSFKEGTSQCESRSHSIREFFWDDGRRFIGSCVGYRPSSGVFLESEDELFFVVFDAAKTFAEGPSVTFKRKLDWQAISRLHSYYIYIYMYKYICCMYMSRDIYKGWRQDV